MRSAEEIHPVMRPPASALMMPSPDVPTIASSRCLNSAIGRFSLFWALLPDGEYDRISTSRTDAAVVRNWHTAAEVGPHQILPVPNEQRTYEGPLAGFLAMIPALRLSLSR